MATDLDTHAVENIGFDIEVEMNAIDTNTSHINAITLPEHCEETDTPDSGGQDEQRNAEQKRDRGTANDGDGTRPGSPGAAKKKGAQRAQYKTYILGVFVRLMLVSGTNFIAWRAVMDTNDSTHWLWLCLCMALMAIEYSIIVTFNQGKEWAWWCPCFLVYLGCTLPLVWQIQLKQRDDFLNRVDSLTDTTSYTASPAPNATNTTDVISTSTTIEPLQLEDLMNWRTVYRIGADTWTIMVNESLVYLVIFARWLLPRGGMSREDVSEMLLEYLAIASDIMEVLALFDEGTVRDNFMLTYWILGAWSVSFVQFIPVLKYIHSNSDKEKGEGKYECLDEAEHTSSNSDNKKRKHDGLVARVIRSESFPDMTATLLNLTVQDGSFLILRLYIMIKLNFVTYSLTFFVMKNILTVMVLVYRLMAQVHKCFRDRSETSSHAEDGLGPKTRLHVPQDMPDQHGPVKKRPISNKHPLSTLCAMRR